MEESPTFDILHVNARSIFSNEKFDQFQTFLYRGGHRWAIIFVCETWLNKDMEYARDIDGYTGFFDSRVNNIGGGVAIYVKDSVISQGQLHPKLLSTTQSLFIECQVGSHSLMLGVIYRPPNLHHDLFLEDLGQCLDALCLKNKSIIICGDFNFDLFSLQYSNTVQSFFNLFTSSGFLPLISKASRKHENCHTLLDNFFCNNLNIVKGSGLLFDDFSDHFPICASLDIKSHHSNIKKTTHVFDYHKMPQFRNHLLHELNDFERINDPEIACSILINAYQSGIDKFSYLRTSSRKTSSIKPWITPGILASINNRCRLFKIKEKYPCEENITKYRQYRNILNGLIRDAKKAYIQNELEINKNNPKKMWDTLLSYSRGKKQGNCFPDSFLSEDGDSIDSHLDVADKFNKFFSSIGADLQQNIPHCTESPLTSVQHSTETINNINPTSPDELEKLIKEMKNVGGGVDGINSKIFKASYKVILVKLVHFINICLLRGVFPSQLKVAVIKPIYKSGGNKHFSNYRPISILPYISKILEKVIYLRLVTHFENCNVISANQFGFRKHLSTYMPLLLLQDKITKAFEKNNLICGIYLDLKKAFDTVDHEILTLKLQAYGITDTALTIIKSYLSNRFQCVEYLTTRSPLCPINIGVPQGSILGPLLFIIYINDLPNICSHSSCLLYADDTALFFESETQTDLQSKIELDLPAICKWFQINKLTLNATKTYCQLYNNSKSNVNISVELNGTHIDFVNTVKYLGMYVDVDMKWKSHINHISKIVSRNIGIMNRSKFFLDQKHLFLLYNALVLPYLNYCCLIWGLSSDTLLKPLEILQKKAVRIIDNQQPRSHSLPIFRRLNILKVQDIARQQIIVVLFRTLFESVPAEISSLFTLCQFNERASRAVKHFEEMFTAKLYRTRTISWLGPRLWNSKIASKFPSLNSVPRSKNVLKTMVKTMLINEY